MPRLSPIQEELIGLMALAGIEPTMRPGPAALVTLPKPHDAHWRDLHGGKPVKSNTVAALERAGLLTRIELAQFAGYRRWLWRLTDAGRALGERLSRSD